MLARAEEGATCIVGLFGSAPVRRWVLEGVLPSFGELTTAAGISLVIPASKKLLMMNEWLDLGGWQIALSDRYWVLEW